MIDINPADDLWSIELLDRSAAVTVGHYTQYFCIHQGHVAPCDSLGNLEPHSAVAAHKLPKNVERRTRSYLKTLEDT